MNNLLLYYVVGGDVAYADVLRYSINTVRCFPDNDQLDIMVMCDSEYAKTLQGMPVTLHVTEKNRSHVESSMRKTEIFDFGALGQYEKVLYLDADTVVTGALAPLFDAVTDGDLLYVVPERDAEHTTRYYQCGDDPYDACTLEGFRASGICPFNAGQFAFKRSASMRAHFEALASHVKRYDPALHFYEQSFMNNHFNRLGRVDYALEKYVKLFACQGVDCERIVQHFCDTSVPFFQKLECMRDCHARFWETRTRRLASAYESREVIAEAVALPARPSVAEVGSFKGDFAEVLLRSLDAGTVHVIDPWVGTVVSGNQDGNDLLAAEGDRLHEFVKARFAGNPQVLIHRVFSKDMELPRGSLDLVYIDGDHSYEGVRRDLSLAKEWVRNGGYICGHDYSMNYEKTNNHYEFGVRKAVDEFCREHGCRIWSFLNDGCVSFVIRV